MGNELGCKETPGGSLGGKASLEMLMPGGRVGRRGDLLSLPFDLEGVREMPPRLASLSWTSC